MQSTNVCSGQRASEITKSGYLVDAAEFLKKKVGLFIYFLPLNFTRHILALSCCSLSIILMLASFVFVYLRIPAEISISIHLLFILILRD
jgi:hypothetical protein